MSVLHEDEFQDKKVDFSMWRKLVVEFAGPYKGLIFRIIACMMVSGVADVMFSRINAWVIDNFVSQSRWNGQRPRSRGRTKMDSGTATAMSKPIFIVSPAPISPTGTATMADRTNRPCRPRSRPFIENAAAARRGTRVMMLAPARAIARKR